MPKWTHKGHQYDKLGNIFLKNPKMLLLGTDNSYLDKLKKELDFVNLGNNIKTLLINNFFKKLLLPIFINKNNIVIVSQDNLKLFNILKSKGFKENENLFIESEFLKTYLSIYALYVCKKTYSGIAACSIVTTYCTLNCKYCSNFEPYIKDKKHNDFEGLKQDIDLFFKCFDRVKYFSLSGGEPFLYPKIIELVEYIGKNYSNKYNIFQFPTNGTIVPSDELCNILKKYNIAIVLDNYCKYAPEITKKFPEVLSKLKQFDINYTVQNTYFTKLFPPVEEYSKLDDEKNAKRFEICRKYYNGKELRQGKLYGCCCAGFSDTAKLVPAEKSDYFDLNCVLEDESKKFELIEFVNGYSEKGYLTQCLYCNGFNTENGTILDENGVSQVDKRTILEWDINNPVCK